MDNHASYIPSEDLGAHPAVRAWLTLQRGGPEPRGIVALRPLRKRIHKSCAFRLDGLGPRGSSIVAKLCLRETAQLESFIYESILPNLPIPQLEYYGKAGSEDPEMDWIFVEYAGDERYSRNDEVHRRLAAEWIAAMHVSAWKLPALKQLPDRGPAYYLDCLRSARRRIEASRSNKVITRDQRTVLDCVDAYLQLFEDSWNGLERLCQSLPRTLVHGDLGGRNGRIRNNGDHRTLVVFDWETAGTGVPAGDLTSSRIDALSCCLRTYFSSAKGTWPFLTLEDIVLFERIGRILRVIAAIDWASVELSFERADCLVKPVGSMRSYLKRIEYELQEPVWTGQFRGISGTFGNASQPAGRTVYSDLSCGRKKGLIEGMNELLSDSERPGSFGLCHSLKGLLPDNGSNPRLCFGQRLGGGVYRLRFGENGSSRSLVVKRLAPEIAKRNTLVAKRWLPAIGLAENGPPLLGCAPEPEGERVWHIYEDLGNWDLKETNPDPERIRPAVELIAKLHARFVEHPWLAECRLWGGDLGTHFYSTSVQDAIGSLERLKPPWVELNSERATLRDRLLGRLRNLQDELPRRLEVVKEFGGPETLLHGDLWPQNVLVIPSPEGPRVCLIDWDHAAVGPITYDLSTLFLRSQPDVRRWILDFYRQAPETPSWQAPPNRELNLLFETAECARMANCVIWTAIGAGESQAAWAFDQLKEIDDWFEALTPGLPV